MRRLLLITMALLACDEAIEPASGTWDFDVGEQTRNTCNYDGVGGRGGLFSVLDHGDGTLTIDPQDGTDPFECSLHGRDFDCPERFQSEVQVSGYDATLIIHTSADGVFESSTRASGAQFGRVQCEGSACADLAAAVDATLPCEFEEEFDAAFEE